MLDAKFYIYTTSFVAVVLGSALVWIFKGIEDGLIFLISTGILLLIYLAVIGYNERQKILTEQGREGGKYGHL